MSDDPSMLPETLRLAMSRLRPDPGLPNSIAALDGEAWRYIRAELLRLARENAELHKSAMGGYEDGWHALRNERDALKAELAKLRARIAEAPVITVRRQIDGDGDTGKLPSRDDLPADYIGKRVRLLVEDEG